MALTKTRYEHIRLDSAGVPVIGDTTMKVVELVAEQKAYGWSPEELHFQHPYLTLGQIHSALAYFWDHAAELEEDLEQRMARVEALRASQGDSPLRKRLRESRR